MFLLTVIPAFPSASGHLAGELLGAQVDEHQVVVGAARDERKPRLRSASASACAFSTIRRWYSLNSGWSASLERHRLGGDDVLERPALDAREDRLSIAFACSALAQRSGRRAGRAASCASWS